MTTFKRIRTMFPDHLGIARGKYISGRLADEGSRFCIATFALNYDRDLIPTSTSRMLEGMPDVDLGFASSDIHLETLRAFREFNSNIAAVATPILYSNGQLLETRLIEEMPEHEED